MNDNSLFAGITPVNSWDKGTINLCLLLSRLIYFFLKEQQNPWNDIQTSFITKLCNNKSILFKFLNERACFFSFNCIEKWTSRFFSIALFYSIVLTIYQMWISNISNIFLFNKCQFQIPIPVTTTPVRKISHQVLWYK